VECDRRVGERRKTPRAEEVDETMSDITREQFAAAVAAAISSVYHLYREVDRLLVGLRDALAEEPIPLAPVRGTFSAKAGRDPGRLVLRHEYGTLFKPISPDEEDLDDDDEDEGDDEADEGDGEEAREKQGKEKRAADIAADQPLLGLRVAMHDTGKQANFEPQIQYAVMSEWAIGNAFQPAEQFVLQRYMLRRIPRALGGALEVPKGARLVTRSAARRIGGRSKGEDRRLSCRLPEGVVTVPLYSLDSPEQLERLAESVKTMWASATKSA
jgi:hypothetical protein